MAAAFLAVFSDRRGLTDGHRQLQVTQETYFKRPISDKAYHLHAQGWVQDKEPGAPDPGLAHRAGAQSRQSRPQHSEAKMHEDLVSKWRKGG